MKKVRTLYIMGTIFMLLALASASDIYIKYNELYDLKVPCFNNGSYCSDSALCNLTLMLPNGELIVDNSPMTYNPSYFNYTFELSEIEKAPIGIYQASMCCLDNGEQNCGTFTIEMTGNGKPPASSGIVIVYIIGFLIIIGFLVYIIIYDMGHIINMDFDLLDLAFNWGLYFSLFGFYMLGEVYLGNPEISNILTWILSIGALTNGVVPLIALIVSLFYNAFQRKKFKLNPPMINIGRRR